MDDIVKLTIDGQAVEAKKGMTVLQAAEESGFLIPTLCADVDLKSKGGNDRKGAGFPLPFCRSGEMPFGELYL